MNHNQPPTERPFKNPPVDFITVHYQADSSSGLYCNVPFFTARAARQYLAEIATQEANYWSLDSEANEAAADRLNQKPAGHYNNMHSGGQSRSIEKHSPYCLTVHKYTESIPRSVTFYAKLNQAEAQQ